MKKESMAMTDAEFESAVREVVRGSVDSRDAFRRISNAFTPTPLFWVNDKGTHQFHVFIQRCAGAAHHSIICDRN